MQSFIVKRTTYRFILALILFAIIATLFWTSSRYPDLGDKAMMSGAIQLEDPLSFEAHWPIKINFPIWKKISYTTLNWLHTNRKGMLFGILMGAVFLTLMRYIGRVSFRNTFMNSSLGLLVGAPLGVCVNCAAPIAKGMYSGGVRAETVLAAMIASPTLNIVVLSMLFSILPFYMAATKLALSLFVIVIGVPLICHFLPRSQLQLPQDQQRACPIPMPANTSREPIWSSIKGFTADFGSDLWYILRLTVPLMILAGFLGAVVATFIPLELLNDLRFGIIGLLIVALIGTFLPVPIAFDIVICGALLAAGLNVGYVMTLLFTLGIFSIYSFFIIGQSISIRAASLIAGLVIIIGIGAGIGVNQWHAVKTHQAMELLTANTALSQHVVLPEDLKKRETKSNELAAIDKATDIPSKIKITRKPFNERSPSGNRLFEALEARDIGIDKPLEFSFKDMWPPFWEGRSISAGDYDRDGSPDLVLASTRQGLYFYKNSGKGEFTRDNIELGELNHWPIFNAVFVDLNNDGWLDIFLATYRQGNYVLWNNNGTFDASKLTPVINRDDAMLSLALSFSDVDQNGYLDLAVGNWAAGWYRRIPGEESRNRIIYNETGQLSGNRFKELPGLPGETLSILLTDLNADGHADLLVGNDFEQPDVYYYGDGKGEFARIRSQDDVIPFTTTTTMSIKNSDLNNDLIPEIYIAQIAGRSTGISERLKMQPIERYCDGIKNTEDKQICEKNMDIKTWYKSGNNFDPSYANKCQTLDATYAAECKAMLVKDLAIQAEDPSICELINKGQPDIRAYCDIHFKPSRKSSAAELQDQYPQIKHRNVLLMRQPDGTYKDNSLERGLDVGGWSWDTKIADFDNDEWPDVYIVNGTWVPNEFTPSNMYFVNQGNGEFEEAAKSVGLEDYLMTAAATQLDIDNDGDLDLITIPVNGPTKAFINTSQTENAIRFELRDHIGNHFGVGTKIIIHYGVDNKRHQMQEIQLGGGFQSFDMAVAHFGLGKNEMINTVTILWPDGGKNEITESLQSGATYIIERNPE